MDVGTTYIITYNSNNTTNDYKIPNVQLVHHNTLKTSLNQNKYQISTFPQKCDQWMEWVSTPQCEIEINNTNSIFYNILWSHLPNGLQGAHLPSIKLHKQFNIKFDGKIS